MAEPQDHPLQTLYRLSVMVGTLACGSMAAYHYGPPAGELAEMIDATAEHLGVVADTGEGAAPAPVAPAADYAAAPAFSSGNASPSTPAATSDGARFDSQVQQATAIAPIAPPAQASVETPLDRERLTAPLLAAGAQTADVTPWGRGPRPMYRASASAGVSAGGLQARFDAIGESPEAAVADVLAQLRASSLR